MQDTPDKVKETMLTLTTVCVVGFLLTQSHSTVWLYAAVILGLTGMFLENISRHIHRVWFKLAEAMGFVMNKLILGLVFFVFLLPFSLLKKLGSTDVLQRKPGSKTLFTIRNHTYTPRDFEKTW